MYHNLNFKTKGTINYFKFFCTPLQHLVPGPVPDAFLSHPLLFFSDPERGGGPVRADVAGPGRLLGHGVHPGGAHPRALRRTANAQEERVEEGGGEKPEERKVGAVKKARDLFFLGGEGLWYVLVKKSYARIRNLFLPF